jgi:DNA (cytosine-5)-methyltransferase 1
MKFSVIEICAGVGGFGLGFEQYGQVLAAVEWDKAAAGVYKYNNPEVEMFCDLTEVRATDLPWDADDLVICGGTPCQAFSVAGKRGSLSDDRGNLALTFNNLCNAIDDLRLNAGKEPAIIIWENVCGVLNTDDNAFGCVLGGMAGSDAPLVPVGEQRWTNAGVVVGPRRAVSFRVLDSQYFGVAQRRRRVFAVAIGGSRKWAAPEALVPQQKSLPRNPKKGESSGEGSPGNAGSSFTGASFGKYEEGVGTLRSQGGDLGGGSETLAVYDARGNGDGKDVSVTLRSQQGGEGVGVAFHAWQDPIQSEECSPNMGSNAAIGVLQNLTVRRLSSVECMRLQGWPDTHCDFKMELERDGNRWKPTGKAVKQAEGPKYKQAGNGVTANVAAYIAGKLMDALSK